MGSRTVRRSDSKSQSGCAAAAARDCELENVAAIRCALMYWLNWLCLLGCLEIEAEDRSLTLLPGYLRRVSARPSMIITNYPKIVNSEL